MQSYEDQPLDLRKYLAILRARKWIILIIAILVTGLAISRSYRQTSVYETSARLLLKPDLQTGYYPTGETEAAVVSGEAVSQVVIENENLAISPQALLSGVSAALVSPAGTVLTVTYRSADPVFAQVAANAFATGYLDYKREQAFEGVSGQRQALERRHGSIQEQITQLIGRTETARKNGNESLVSQLDGERVTLTARLIGVQQELDALQGSGDVSIRFGEVLQAAPLPRAPSSPNHRTDGIIGGLLGLALGIGLGFLRERLDDRFRGRSDVEQSMEAPVLATVPRFPKDFRSRGLIVVGDPKGPASEAYRNLRTSLQFLLAQRNAKTLLITSPSEHEGKTVTTANLGFALAQTGRRVVLVSGDLRRPQLEKYFGIKADLGLTNYLLGEVDDIGKIVLEDPNTPGLRVLPSGPIPSNPAELLTSPRVSQLVSELEEHADILIFDAPPVLPVADSVILASHLGLAMLILDAANTQRSAATHAKELLERVGAEVIGCVLNAFDPSGSPYYYEPYYYSKYYSKAEEDGRASGDDQVEVQLGAGEPAESQRTV